MTKVSYSKISNGVTRLIILLIKAYQITCSPDHGLWRRMGRGCRFYPSCSDYACQAIGKFGILRGFWQSVKRVLKCHPFSEGGYDPL